MTRRAVKPQVFAWAPYAYLGARVFRSRRELFLYVSGGGETWIAMAFEGPSNGGAHAVLADHGHRIVGEYASSAAAQRAAQGFAKKWLRGKSIEDCGCGEVSA
jgi:hypothetical protein